MDVGGEEGMGQELKNQKYEDYIADVSPKAAAIGRREPYHLAYLRQYGETAMPPGKHPGKDMGKGGSRDDKSCM